MTDFEVGSESEKITRRILSEMVEKTPFDKETVESIEGSLDKTTIEQLFAKFLKNKTKKA